jgi:hypothetical protein
MTQIELDHATTCPGTATNFTISRVDRPRKSRMGNGSPPCTRISLAAQTLRRSITTFVQPHSDTNGSCKCLSISIHYYCSLSQAKRTKENELRLRYMQLCCFQSSKPFSFMSVTTTPAFNHGAAEAIAENTKLMIPISSASADSPPAMPAME